MKFEDISIYDILKYSPMPKKLEIGTELGLFREQLDYIAFAEGIFIKLRSHLTELQFDYKTKEERLAFLEKKIAEILDGLKQQFAEIEAVKTDNEITFNKSLALGIDNLAACFRHYLRCEGYKLKEEDEFYSIYLIPKHHVFVKTDEPFSKADLLAKLDTISAVEEGYDFGFVDEFKKLI